MYFYKDNKALFSNRKSRAKKCDLSTYENIYNFIRHIYKDKQKSLKDLNANYPKAIPDIVASSIRSLCDSGFIHRDILSKSLTCCFSILSDMGYLEISMREIRNRISNSDIYIIIPGCQTEEILDNRVNKAVSVFNDLHCTAKFIPSGKNSSRKRTEKCKISNESARIISGLNNKLGSIKFECIPLDIEKCSSSTSENIRNIFESNLIDVNRKFNIIIVSSTFHLIRLARQVELRKTRIPNFDNLILVGAETKVDSVVKMGAYVKSMMFDIYDYLLGLNK